MGGRLDATNIVDPMLSIITDISLDHMEWLGPTIADIAREKAGILRQGGTLITLPQHPEANQALGEVATSLSVLGVSATPYMPVPDAAERGTQLARENNARTSYTIQVMGQPIEIDSQLHGAHQHRNIALAVAGRGRACHQPWVPGDAKVGGGGYSQHAMARPAGAPAG